MSKPKLSIDFLREAIAVNGWGTIPDAAQTYSPEPIADPEPETTGTIVAVDPHALTEDEDQKIADAFKLVAACLISDPDFYGEFLGALMDGGA